MKTEHKYAQVLRWIADGEQIEWLGWGASWHPITTEALLKALSGEEPAPPKDFRLKPSTITVNGREIVAPIHHPDEGQEVWSFDVLGNVFRTTYRSGKSMSYAAAEFGAIFASEHDAECARDEISKLLKSAW